MRFRFKLLILLLSLFLGACSSKPEHDQKAHNTFTTDIHSDGSKRFVIAMAYEIDANDKARSKGKRSGARGDGGGRGKDGGRGQSRPQRGDQQDSSFQANENDSSEDKREEIIVLLEEKILETGYCRHGYIELDYSQMRDKTELTGECQESASNEDKQRWD